MLGGEDAYRPDVHVFPSYEDDSDHEHEDEHGWIEHEDEEQGRS